MLQQLLLALRVVVVVVGVGEAAATAVDAMGDEGTSGVVWSDVAKAKDVRGEGGAERAVSW
jgi:hypothetical protein